MYRRFMKRFFDIVLSVLILFLLFPVYLVTAIAVRLDSEGPALLKQARLGRGGKVFYMYKFRSMCVGAERMGTGVYSGKDDARVTRVGRFLRATSMDELPQAWNILKGDMSFIGPRPPLVYHPWPIEEYSDEQLRMFDVRPGITGWAQVHGRKDVEWNLRIRLNTWYVDHLSPGLDIRILFMTFFKVLSNADNVNLGATVEISSPTEFTEPLEKQNDTDSA